MVSPCPQDPYIGFRRSSFFGTGIKKITKVYLVTLHKYYFSRGGLYVHILTTGSICVNQIGSGS